MTPQQQKIRRALEAYAALHPEQADDWAKGNTRTIIGIVLVTAHDTSHPTALIKELRIAFAYGKTDVQIVTTDDPAQAHLFTQDESPMLYHSFHELQTIWKSCHYSISNPK